MRDIRLWCVLFALMTLASPAISHQVGGDGYLHLKVDGESIQAQWGIALFSFGNVLALDGNHDGKIGNDEAQERLGAMAEYALARLKLSTTDGVCTLQPGDHEVAGRHAVIRFTPRCPPPVETLTFGYHLFFDVDPLHRGLLRLEHQDRTHTGIFTPQRPVQQIQLVEVRPWQQFLEYVIEGVWHIWIGFDHILFLVALLLPAVLRRQGHHWEPVTRVRDTWVSVIKIVTAFTIAHSLTLGAAALDVVTPPPRLVESIIALSVMVAALNNLYPIIPAQRMVMLTFGFGLIHGFGFAGVLQELGLPSRALVRSLLGFNVGVEVGQMAVVGIALPCAYALRRRWLYPRVILTCGSVAIAGIAGLWFVERAFDLAPLLPSAPEVDPRAELERVVPYMLPQLNRPLVIVGSMLLALMSTVWALTRAGMRRRRVSQRDSLRTTRLIGYGLVGALGVLALGIGVAFSTARQEALRMATAAQISGQLAEPLRRQLKIAEPRDMAYQEQLTAVREAITFLVEHHRRHATADQMSEAMARLAAGQTAMAQTILKQQAEAAAADGGSATAATAERHRGALALLEDAYVAVGAYRRAVELDPQDWRGWTALAYLHGRTEQYPEAEAAARRALELSQAVSDPALVGKSSENLAAIYHGKGAWEEAEAAYREALDIYRVLGNELGMARVYTHVGTLYAVLRRFDKAQAMFRDALSVHQRLADKEGMAVDYAHLGAVYTARGLFEHAEAMYRQALALNEASERKPGLALVYADMGRLYQRRGDPRQAEQMYRQALAIDEALGYRPGMASHYANLGTLSRQAGHLDQAATLLRQAISIDEALGHHLGLAINAANLAGVYQTQGDSARAEVWYQRALAANTRLGRTAGKAANYAHLGHLYRQRGHVESAQEMYRQSLALFSEAGVRAGVTQVQAWLNALQTSAPVR
jgi:tetratricopeptide (TPR) repeat protein